MGEPSGDTATGSSSTPVNPHIECGGEGREWPFIAVVRSPHSCKSLLRLEVEHEAGVDWGLVRSTLSSLLCSLQPAPATSRNYRDEAFEASLHLTTPLHHSRLLCTCWYPLSSSTSSHRPTPSLQASLYVLVSSIIDDSAFISVVFGLLFGWPVIVATSLRKHGNESCGHYYSHLAFAHLKELMREHHHFQAGNDEVLEKGNRDMKRLRDMTFWGGDSSADAQAKKITATRYRVVTEAKDGEEAVYEPYTVEVTRHKASWVACMKMQVAADLLAARRPHKADERGKAKRAHAKAAQDASRDAVKMESVKRLKPAASPDETASI